MERVFCGISFPAARLPISMSGSNLEQSPLSHLFWIPAEHGCSARQALDQGNVVAFEKNLSQVSSRLLIVRLRNLSDLDRVVNLSRVSRIVHDLKCYSEGELTTRFMNSSKPRIFPSILMAS